MFTAELKRKKKKKKELLVSFSLTASGFLLLCWHHEAAAGTAPARWAAPAAGEVHKQTFITAGRFRSSPGPIDEPSTGVSSLLIKQSQLFLPRFPGFLLRQTERRVLEVFYPPCSCALLGLSWCLTVNVF